jgi:FkbM family methyltransferase
VYNIALNGLGKRVTAFNVALWNKKNVCYLNLASLNGDTLMPLANAKIKIPVPTEKISDIIDKHAISQIDWVKVDVEDAEVCVLKGFEDYIHMPRRYIMEIMSPSNLS